MKTDERELKRLAKEGEWLTKEEKAGKVNPCHKDPVTNIVLILFWILMFLMGLYWQAN
jgi:hypothetical protein